MRLFSDEYLFQKICIYFSPGLDTDTVWIVNIASPTE